MRALASLCLLIAAGKAAAAPVTAIIWRGGAKTPEEAAKAVEEWKAIEELAAWAGISEAYPKIVESKSIPGLRPGFHAVLLGFCPADEAARILALLKVVDPEIYGRPVDGPEDACPRTATDLAVSGPVKVKAGERNTLTVTAISGTEEGRGGVAVGVLRDASGKVLERRAVVDQCFDLDVERLDRSRVRVRGKCITDGCTQNEVSEMSWTVEAEEAIATKQRRGRVIQKRECD